MPKKLLRAAAILYFIITAYWLLMGFMQATVSLILIKEEETLSTFLKGLWNIGVAHVYVAIGVGLVYEARRAKDWGLWSAVLSVPLVLVTGGINVLNVFLAFLYLIIIVLLVAEKFSARAREDEVLPSGRPSGWQD